MKQISNKEYEKYQQYQTDKLHAPVPSCLTSLEPVGDVALVGAVLPVSVPVCGEGFPAAGAGKGVDRFPVDLQKSQ